MKKTKTVVKWLIIAATMSLVAPAWATTTHLENNQQLAWTTKVTRYVRHTVKKGDTIERIARIYGASLQQVLVENNLQENDSLTEGKKLIIPVKGYTQRLII